MGFKRGIPLTYELPSSIVFGVHSDSIHLQISFLLSKEVIDPNHTYPCKLWGSQDKFGYERGHLLELKWGEAGLSSRSTKICKRMRQVHL